MTHLYVDLPINILISKLKRDTHKNELIKCAYFSDCIFKDVTRTIVVKNILKQPTTKHKSN